jgi:hypothetical protein
VDKKVEPAYGGEAFTNMLSHHFKMEIHANAFITIA